MQIAVSDLIKAAFDEVIHGPDRQQLLDDLRARDVLEGVLPEALPGIAWSPGSQGWRRDALWTGVIGAYRRSGGACWGGVILELTRPVLVPALQRLGDVEIGAAAETTGNPVPLAGLDRHHGAGCTDDEDVAQEVIAVSLRLAGSCALPCPSRWTPHRLATQTLRFVRRELRREAGRANRIVSFDVDDANCAEAEAPEEGRTLVQMLVSYGCSRAEAELIVATVVLGRSLEQIGRTSGVTYQALWQRRARALERLRRSEIAA